MNCCYFDVSPLRDGPLFEKGLRELIWDDRAEKINTLRQDKDKRLCLGAGLLAADMLRQAGAADLRLGVSEQGKPYLKGCPGIHFSISHDGEIAVCAVAEVPVGIDIQQKTHFEPAAARIAFCDAERCYAGSFPDRDAAYTRLWARKESYVKLLGTGFINDPDKYNAVPGGDAEQGVHFSEHRIGEYFISICCAESFTADMREWKFEGKD
ncbi:MAG: 4'-phosphopantetheinyl transferase superfamily protein [Ruminococcus sp.]|nr:4'-phosphopantetheinyl transferase superfamily protein [Ruminococcus sp.]